MSSYDSYSIKQLKIKNLLLWLKREGLMEMWQENQKNL